MSARDDYPWTAQRCHGDAEIHKVFGEIDRLRDEVAAAHEVLARARRHAHTCGLFTGGYKMDTYVAIVDMLQQLDEES